MAPQEVDDRIQAFLAELGTQHEPPWDDAKSSNDEKEQDR